GSPAMITIIENSQLERAQPRKSFYHVLRLECERSRHDDIGAGAAQEARTWQILPAARVQNAPAAGARCIEARGEAPWMQHVIGSPSPSMICTGSGTLR